MYSGDGWGKCGSVRKGCERRFGIEPKVVLIPSSYEELRLLCFTKIIANTYTIKAAGVSVAAATARDSRSPSASRVMQMGAFDST